MNDMSQLASAMLVLVFAAVMLVVGQLYIENRSAKTFVIPTAQASLMCWKKPTRQIGVGAPYCDGHRKPWPPLRRLHGWSR